MNWAAMNYVKRLKRESGINGNLRFLLMMIAGRIPRGHMESSPTSLKYYASMTGNSVKTIQNLRDKLLEKDAIRIGQKGRGAGKYQTYIIPALAGPLFMVPPDGPMDGGEKGENLTGNSPPEKGVRVSRFHGPEKGASLSPLAPKNTQFLPGSVRTRTSKDVRTKNTTTAENPVAAVICDETLSFLHWWPAVYSEHAGGADVTVDYEKDGPRIQKLLSGPPRRELDRLKAMAVVMLTLTPAEDPFLAVAPDRGLRLLAFAADRYDRISRRREQVTPSQPAGKWWWSSCSHTPKCETFRRCAELNRDAENGQEATG